MRDDYQSALLFDGVDALFNGAQVFRGFLHEQPEQMSLARRDLYPRNQAQRVIALRQQVSHALRALDMVVVGHSDQVEPARYGYLNDLCGTGPAVAQVGMHMEIGAAIPGWWHSLLRNRHVLFGLKRCMFHVGSFLFYRCSLKGAGKRARRSASLLQQFVIIIHDAASNMCPGIVTRLDKASLDKVLTQRFVFKQVADSPGEFEIG